MNINNNKNDSNKIYCHRYKYNNKCQNQQQYTNSIKLKTTKIVSC